MTVRKGFPHAYVPKDHAIHVYRESIAAAAKAAKVRLHYEELAVSCKFVFRRPKSHTNKSGLKPEAPLYPREDVDNLAKGVLDALNGIAYLDDSQITRLLITKEYNTFSQTEVTLELS